MAKRAKRKAFGVTKKLSRDLHHGLKKPYKGANL